MDKFKEQVESCIFKSGAMRYCSLCFKTKEKPGKKTFFKVPKDEHRRKQWGEVCRIDFKKKTAWICIDHFLPSHIVRSGRKTILIPSAVPFIAPVQKSQIEAPGARRTSNTKKTKRKKNNFSENQADEFAPDVLNSSNKNVVAPLEENLLMEIPIKKSVYCTGSTQTNTRFCGLVEASDFAEDFRFNCFYCSEVFPLEKWKRFVNHLKKNHFENEKAFEVSEYVSGEHDYTPINLPSSTLEEPVFKTVGINIESLLPFLVDPDEPTDKPIESIILNSNFFLTPDDKNAVSNKLDVLSYASESGNSVEQVNENVPFSADILNNFSQTESSPVSISTSGTMRQSNNTNSFKNSKIKSTKQRNLNMNKMRYKSMQTSTNTVLNRCLRRSKKEVGETSDIPQIDQQRATEISFEYTPRVIIDLLLDSMKDYPILWQFNNEPFNEEFFKAVESLCRIINEKWSLNIDNLKMRRSINRILRFYCYLFPNENVENIHEYTCYYDKCADFLPSSVNEIAYARCSHCYICYKNDFNLKHHLLKEQKHNLQWPYKCVQCKECFRENDEYEFHRLLSHYDEIFRCEPCNKKFLRRNIYNKHMSEYHSKVAKEPRHYKCDLCDKEFETIHSLRYHKIKHGERKYKCHLCPKSYFESAKLRLHLKIHRREYDFMCEVCGKAFLLQAPLTVHMKKHTGEKVSCHICNLKLRKSSLSRHLRLLHGANEEGAIGRPGKRIPSYRWLIRPTPLRRKKEGCGMRIYRCQICNLSYDKYKLLAEHNKQFHSDIPKLACQMCCTEFKHKVNLKRHYRRKHNLHVIQVFKLVEENEDLNDVLSIKTEQLNKLSGISSKKSPIIKSEFFSEEISYEEEKLQSFTIEEDILEDSDNISKEEIKIDYMSDLFTDILK